MSSDRKPRSRRARGGAEPRSLPEARGGAWRLQKRRGQRLPSHHAVQFYEDESFLCDVVADFLGAGLAAGESVIVIATPEHREAFTRRLAGRGVDTDEARGAGQLVMLDAAESLSRFMVGDVPDGRRFHAFAVEHLARLDERRPGAPPRKLRAFGEMVDLLWRADNRQGAVQLEELWNDLQRETEFSLLCAYRMGGFYRELDGAGGRDVCLAHSHVLPSESYARLGDADDRMREVSRLQLRAAALEAEVARRKELEGALRDALRERGRAEEALRQEREALVRTNQYLDRFAYVASHDLKAPLRAIANLSAWIEEDQAGHMTPESRELMRLLRGRVHRMEGFIDGIHRYARAGRKAQSIESVDVAGLLAEVIDAIQPPDLLRPKGPQGRARFVVARGIPVFDTERLPLYQVFQNLIVNAIQHAGKSDPTITLRASEADAFYRFSVSDDGPGIAPEFHESIWQVFVTLEARDVVEASGMGLSIVKKIVETRGGKAWVESAPGAGATFHFLWPRRSPEPQE